LVCALQFRRRVKLLALAVLTSLAACTAHTGTGTTIPTTPAAPTPASGDDNYGGELAALDGIFLVTVDSYTYASDRYHFDSDRRRDVIVPTMFTWIALDAAIHYSHGNASGAVLGPAIKFGVPYLMLFHTRWLDRHPALETILTIACMVVDDAVIARTSHPAAPAMIQVGRSF
jgi:hypothetical protein